MLGTQHRSLPASTGDFANAYQDVDVVHDLCTETIEVPPPTLPWTAGTVRDMARLGQQGEPFTLP